MDLLFVGGAVYATYQHGYHPAIRQFLKDVDKRKVKKVAVFVTFAFSDSIGKLENLVTNAGLALAGEKFACKGKLSSSTSGIRTKTTSKRRKSSQGG